MGLPLGADLRSLRAATNRTQDEVGRMCNCSRGLISLVERELYDQVSDAALARIRLACEAMRAELESKLETVA